MKFGRCLLVVSWVAVLVPCAVACGSASSNGLFSAAGGSSNVSHAGADGVTAGASAVAGDAVGGATGSSGASNGLGGHEQSAGGKGAAGSPAESGAAGAATTGGGSGGKGQGGESPSGGSAGALVGGSGGDGAGGASPGGAGAGTSGGTAGGGSAGSPGTGCPDNAPTQAANCQTTTPDSCFYAGVACSCEQTGLNSFQRKWACYGTPDKCPDTAPNAGTGPCKGGAECPYPDAFCVCGGNGGGNNDKYICQSAGVPQCPTLKPLNGAQCSSVRSCAYADDQCFCNGSNWDCESTN
jgi:hypothetical protein